jgi:hypothetical protein
MLYFRTASRAFINAANIVRLSPERGDGAEEITGWVITCTDREMVILASYYAAPGRLEKLMDFIPAIDGEQEPRKRPFGCSVREKRRKPDPAGAGPGRKGSRPLSVAACSKMPQVSSLNTRARSPVLNCVNSSVTLFCLRWGVLFSFIGASLPLPYGTVKAAN